MTINGLEVPRAAAHLIEIAESGQTADVSRLWFAQVGTRPALVMIARSELRIASADGLQSWAFGSIDYVDSDRGQNGTFLVEDQRILDIAFDTRRMGRDFRSSFDYTKSEPEKSSPTSRSVTTSAPVSVSDEVRATAPRIRSNRITTLSEIPGMEITQSHGVVTALTSNAGWTASHKGSTALDAAAWEIRAAAFDVGANAVVGLQVATFGAGGGITSVVGGDAVGVLLMGTAVTVIDRPGLESTP